jgi:hypothetical protein
MDCFTFTLFDASQKIENMAFGRIINKNIHVK